MMHLLILLILNYGPAWCAESQDSSVDCLQSGAKLGNQADTLSAAFLNTLVGGEEDFFADTPSCIARVGQAKNLKPMRDFRDDLIARTKSFRDEHLLALKGKMKDAEGNSLLLDIEKAVTIFDQKSMNLCTEAGLNQERFKHITDGMLAYVLLGMCVHMAELLDPENPEHIDEGSFWTETMFPRVVADLCLSIYPRKPSTFAEERVNIGFLTEEELSHAGWELKYEFTKMGGGSCLEHIACLNEHTVRFTICEPHLNMHKVKVYRGMIRGAAQVMFKDITHIRRILAVTNGLTKAGSEKLHGLLKKMLEDMSALPNQREKAKRLSLIFLFRYAQDPPLKTVFNPIADSDKDVFTKIIKPQCGRVERAILTKALSDEQEFSKYKKHHERRLPRDSEGFSPATKEDVVLFLIMEMWLSEFFNGIRPELAAILNL